MYRPARYAAGYFKTALRLAEAMHESEKALYVAARMYVALVMAVYREGWASDPLATKPFKDEVDHLAKRYSGDRLLAQGREPPNCAVLAMRPGHQKTTPLAANSSTLPSPASPTRRSHDNSERSLV